MLSGELPFLRHKDTQCHFVSHYFLSSLCCKKKERKSIQAPSTMKVSFCFASFVVFLDLSSTTDVGVFAETSDLWGQTGELWDNSNGNSRLKDFTDVGYHNGDDPIPTDLEWPNMVNVLDYGAIPNDDLDDSQAFIDAIAACPSNSAVFVPIGKYIILQQIRVDRDYFVLRGEDMYDTVLYFPKYLEELYPAVYHDDSYGHQGGFFYVDGGTHRSIESLTFEFRPQTKMGFFEFRGANAIKYTGNVQDSWIQNIHIRNADFGIKFDNAEQISVLNIYFDDYINRPAFVSSSEYIRQVAFIGIGMGQIYKCLIHNIEFANDMFHDFDIINVPSYNVVSQVKGPSIALQHHGRGAHHNLYTDADCGVGSGAHGLDDDRAMHNETYWGIKRVDRGWPEHPGGNFTIAKGSDHVFVGYSVDYPEEITPTFYYENIVPENLIPINIYLAQMDYMAKPRPIAYTIAPPLAPELTGDVRMLNPTDDVSIGKDPQSPSLPFDGYLKFDLTNLQDLSSIYRATLRLSTNTRTSTNFWLKASSVTDDSWTEDTINIFNPPSPCAALASVHIDDDVYHKWWELDVTSYVQQQWAGDKIVSLHISNDKPGTFLGSMHSKESGNAPLLVIERVADPVPGAPAAPTGISTISENGHIIIHWDDNREADFAYYNVYRTPAPNAGHPVAQGLTMSEYTDVSAKEDRGLCEMPSDTLYYYTITAVDNFGNESPRSIQAMGNTLDPSNNGPEFNVVNHILTNSLVGAPYTTSIAGDATDPENDTLHFFKISGPSWLNVASDGTISATPPFVGSFRITVQVNALGGSDQACFILSVVDDLSNPSPTVDGLLCATPEPTQAPSSAPTFSTSCEELGLSDKTCAELGFTVDITVRNDSLDVCGSGTTDGSKQSDKCFSYPTTWQVAYDECRAIGARLCTKDEIVNFETAKTGCGNDNKLVWTSTECDVGKYYTPRGQGGTFLMECTAATEATKAVQCCGDVTVENCTPSI